MRKKLFDLILIFVFLILVLLVFAINNFSPYYTKIIHRPNTDSFVDISHLQDTCPRNRACSYPTCSLWSDINNDGICDRGQT
jgi:hypothetical protein